MLDHPLDSISGPSVDSAQVIVPMVRELVAPTTVLDVGCGTGAWLRTFECPGVGIDVHDPDNVTGIDYLRRDLSTPFDVGQFDLAVCLEVAEHLPAESAATLITSLTRAAPVVMFSAAIPGQTGHGHVNCQWPDYWARLFAEHGYRQFDALRRRIWDDERVAWWYRQNTFLYAKERTIPEDPMPERVVHPELFAERSRMVSPSAHNVRELLYALPIAARRAISKSK